MLRFSRILRGIILLAFALRIPVIADINRDNNYSASDAFAPVHPKYWLPDNPTPNLGQLIAGLEEESVAHPDDAEIWHQLGLAYRENREFDKELDAMKKATALPGATSQMWSDLAHGYMVNNDMHSAADAFKKATEVAPDNVTAWNDYASLLMTTGEPDKCREVLNDALNLHPHSAQLLTNQALLERQTGEIEGSLNDFRKALEADPTYGFAASDLGTTLFQLQRYSDAVDALTQAVNLRPHDQLPWQALAQSYLKVGSANDALPKLQKILDAHPDSAAGWVAVGAMQDMASIDPTASYQKATQLDPKFGAAWDGLGLAYARHNKLPEALDAFSQAVKVNPDGPQWWNDLGYCQLVEGMVDPAIASFQNSLRRSPKFTRPMVNLAQAYAMKGEKELMQETLTRLDQVDPDLGAKTRQRFQSN